MNILDRYIGRAILEAIFIALLVLLGMQSFIEFINELPDVGTKNYGILQALAFVPMQLPGDLYQFFPIAGIVGVVMGLGRLASQSELVVMRAAGVSIGRILLSVFKTAIILLIGVTLIGEWLAPQLEAIALKRKNLQEYGVAYVMQPGTWVRDANSFIRINQILPDGTLQGVLRYQFDNHRLRSASYAEQGEFKEGHWVFSHITATEFSNTHIRSLRIPQQRWDVTFNPRFLKMSTLDTDQISLLKLYEYIRYLKKNNQSTAHLEFQFWKRIFQPLATLIMVGIGVPFVFGPLRSAAMGLRIVAGIAVGVSFYVLNQFFGPFSMVYQFPPLWAALMPSLLFAVGGGVLLYLIR